MALRGVTGKIFRGARKVTFIEYFSIFPVKIVILVDQKKFCRYLQVKSKKKKKTKKKKQEKKKTRKKNKKKKKEKTKEKKVINFFQCFFHLHFSFFLFFSYIFHFLPFFLASFFPVSHKKFPVESLWGHSAPPPPPVTPLLAL